MQKYVQYSSQYYKAKIKKWTSLNLYRCKANRQLQDPRLTAAAEAAVAEAEAEEQALAAALEAIARLPPKPPRGPRRSLCVGVNICFYLIKKFV